MSGIEKTTGTNFPANLDQGAAPIATGNQSEATSSDEGLILRSTGHNAGASIPETGLGNRACEALVAVDNFSQLSCDLMQDIFSYVVDSNENIRSLLKTSKFFAANVLELPDIKRRKFLKEFEALQITLAKIAGVDAAEFHDIMGRKYCFERIRNQSEFQMNLDYARHIALALDLAKLAPGDDHQYIRALLGVDLTKVDTQYIKDNFSNIKKEVNKFRELLKLQTY